MKTTQQLLIFLAILFAWTSLFAIVYGLAYQSFAWFAIGILGSFASYIILSLIKKYWL